MNPLRCQLRHLALRLWLYGDAARATWWVNLFWRRTSLHTKKPPVHMGFGGFSEGCGHTNAR